MKLSSPDDEPSSPETRHQKYDISDPRYRPLTLDNIGTQCAEAQSEHVPGLSTRRWVNRYADRPVFKTAVGLAVAGALVTLGTRSLVRHFRSSDPHPDDYMD
jgi:hypothetical protein